MNRDVPKISVVIDYGKSFLTITDDDCNNFLSTPPGSELKLSGAKAAMLIAVCQAPESNIYLQKIVPLTRLNEIVDYTFTGDFKLHSRCHIRGYIGPNVWFRGVVRCVKKI